MKNRIEPSRLLFAAAMIGLGITGIINGDFALVWQYVPLHVPGRTLLAYVCAIIELATGLGLLFARTLTISNRILFPFMLLWGLLLRVPVLIRHPLTINSWGGIGEISIMTAGAWCLFANYSGIRETKLLKFAIGSRGTRIARCLLAISLPMIGAEVIKDAIQSGTAVMQPWLQWLPYPAAWAFFTGVASIATCLSLLFGVWPRLAVTLEAVMLGLITIVYWGPDLYTGRTAATAFFISFLITAGAWLVADTYKSVPWLATSKPVWTV